MTTIGRGSTAKIAAACDDGTVRMYDSVTGALRLSLRPELPVLEVTGLPGGSLLVCTHSGPSSITLWDIQTGGLAHTFTFERKVERTTVSLEGRYLACETSENTVKVWKTASRMQHPRLLEEFEGNNPCWLAPEELIMVVDEGSVYIRSVVTKGPPVHKFDVMMPAYRTVYSQIFDRLVIVAEDPFESSFLIIEVKTGTLSFLHNHFNQPSSITFSQTTEQLVYGGDGPGLQTVDISTGYWMRFDFPAKVASISTLSNGTAVANVQGSGIQLLSLDEEHVSPRQPTPPHVTMYPLDKGRITAIKIEGHTILLETATMSQVSSIPTREVVSGADNRTVVICASLEGEIAVCSLEGRPNSSLGMRGFSHRHPGWTVSTGECASFGGISPACDRLATFHELHHQSPIRVWNLSDGRLIAQTSLDNPRFSVPIAIKFDSEDRFSFDYETDRESYVINSVSRTGQPTTYSITRCAEERLDGQASEERYCLDDGREWVICGSQRICWVPLGYIGHRTHHFGLMHCWAGSSLVMVGQDETLRKLTFPELETICWDVNGPSLDWTTLPKVLL